MKTISVALLTLGISSLFLFIGCARLLEIDDDSRDLIALKGWMFQGQEFHIQASNTTSIFNPLDSVQFLPEAQIRIWENEVDMGLMQPDSSQFGDPQYRFIMPGLIAQPGHNYRLEASAPGFETVSVETTAPNLPKIAGIRFIKGEPIPSNSPDYYDPWNVYRNTFEIDIEDEVGVENYYTITRINLKSIENGVPESLSYGQIAYTNPQTLEVGDLIPDKTFADGIGTIRFTVDSYQWTDEATFSIELTNAPIEYVFLRRGEQFIPDDANPFAEPFTEFSNVVGGVGTVFCFSTVGDSTTIFQ